MTKKSVLIVEDEKDIASILTVNLEADGFSVHVLASGRDVHSFVLNHSPDIILLDVMIPDKDGFEVCRQLKQDNHTAAVPIIFLTAKSMEHNVISGLEIGADDYVSKPFSISVLISRIKAVLRRSEMPDSSEESRLSVGGLVVDLVKMTVKGGGVNIQLNTTEFQLLVHLMKRPGWVFNRLQLMETCKGEDSFVTDRSIDVLMVSLRKKLGEFSNLIKTVRGVGYKFKECDI
jgi:two-component system alkaline phosphatase synthesis response regulator PhoP